MSVYSINQRVTDQTAAATATKQQPQAGTAEAAFAQALQTSLRFSPLTGALPGAATALQAHFDRADAAAQQAQPAAQPQAKAPSAPPRSSARSSGSQTDKSQQADASPASGDTNNAPQSAASGSDQSAAPAKPDRPDRPDHAAADNQPQKQSQPKDPSQQDASQQAVDSQAMAAAVMAAAPQQQVQQKTTAPVQTQQATDTGSKASDANAAQDPFAWLQRDHGAMISKLQKQISADAGSDPATPAFGPSLTAATAAKSAAKGMTMVNQAAPSGADQQAQDMAAMLNGTGANLAIHATTTGPQNGAPSAPVVSPAVAVQAAASDGNQANAQADTSGRQGQTPDGTAQGSAASQPQNAVSTAPNPAAQAMDSVSFAAALAAEAADAPAASQQAQGPQTPQGATPLAAVGATQAAESSAPTQAARAPTPPRTPQQEVMDQVSVEINKQAKDGADTIKIALKPGNLGRIEVKLDVKHDGTVSATVTADNKDTLAMLQKDASGLTQALSDAGLKTDSSALSFNLRGDLQQQQQQQQQAGTGGQGRSGRGRRQFGGIDAVGDATASAGALRGGFGRSGVDIQV